MMNMPNLSISLNDNLIALLEYLYQKGIFKNDEGKDWSKSKAINYVLYFGFKKIIEISELPDKEEMLNKINQLTLGVAF